MLDYVILTNYSGSIAGVSYGLYGQDFEEFERV